MKLKMIGTTLLAFLILFMYYSNAAENSCSALQIENDKTPTRDSTRWEEEETFSTSSLHCFGILPSPNKMEDSHPEGTIPIKLKSYEEPVLINHRRNYLFQRGNSSVQEEIFGEDIGERSAELLSRIEVSSLALLTQENYDAYEVDVLQHLSQRTISTCTFTSITTLSDTSMAEPDQGHCFQRRHWTIILLGTPRWASGIVVSAKKQGLYDSRVHWVVLVVGVTDSILSTLPLYEVSQRITWLRWTQQANGWAVLVTVVTANGLIIREAARWDGDILLREASLPLRPPYVQNFFGRALRVVSGDDTFSTVITEDVGVCYYEADGKTTVCTGYVGELLTEIAKSLNMSIINRQVKKCGNPGDPGGRVDVIANDEADISMGTCSMTAERLQAVAFTDFFIVFRSSICSSEPKAILNPLLILSVFTWDTWLAILAFIFVVGFTRWAIAEVISLADDTKNNSLGVFLFVVYKAMLYHGSKEQPHSWSGRAVAAVSWVVIITLAGIYSGNLTAWLSIPRYERPVNSLLDLVRRKDLIPYVALNDPNHQLFKNKTKGVLGIINSRLVATTRENTDEFARSIVNGKAVFFNSDRSHYSRATRLNQAEGYQGFARCRIHLSSQDLLQSYIGFMINKNSWFNEQMNRKIRWLRSYGIVGRLYNQFVRPGCRLYSLKDRRGVLQRLKLTQLQGALLIGLLGIFFACVIFLTEMVFTRNTLEGSSSRAILGM